MKNPEEIKASQDRKFIDPQKGLEALQRAVKKALAQQAEDAAKQTKKTA